MSDVIAQALEDAAEITSSSIDRLAHSINKLGLADAATPMGAIEALSVNLGDKLTDIASALSAVAEALEKLADKQE